MRTIRYLYYITAEVTSAPFAAAQSPLAKAQQEYLTPLLVQKLGTSIFNGDLRHLLGLIAHRLSTVMHADTIFVLEKGRIVESGRHAALLEQKGLCYAMWRQQVGERPALHAPAILT